jgi:hypothetical protein
MHAFLLKMIPAHIGKLLSVRSPLNHASKGRDEFLSAIRKALARLGQPDQGKMPNFPCSAKTRAAGPPEMQSRDRVGGEETRDKSRADLRDLTPLAVLLQESGVSPERVKGFLDSLMADAPEGRMSVEELLGRIRAMLVSEKGGDGRLYLEPGARLRVESALTGMGFSPKEAGQALSPSSAGENDVDVEKFIRLSLMHRTGGLGQVPAEGARKAVESGNTDQETNRAASFDKARISADPQSAAGANGAARIQTTGAPAPGDSIATLRERGNTFLGAPGAQESNKEPPRSAAELLLSRVIEKPAANQDAGNSLFNQAEMSRKQNALSDQGSTSKGGETGAQFDRGKGWQGADSSAPSVKKTVIEEENIPLQSRSFSATGTAAQQNWLKPAGTPVQPTLQGESLIPSHVAAQVSKKISRAVQNGDQMIRFQLNPPRLGILKVQLEWRQDTVRIEMMTDRHPVKEVLIASMAELKQALNEQGVRVEKMDVQVNDSFGQDLSAFDRGRRDLSGAGAALKDELFPIAEEDKGNDRIYPLDQPDGRLLHVVA